MLFNAHRHRARMDENVKKMTEDNVEDNVLGVVKINNDSPKFMFYSTLTEIRGK